MTDSVPRLIRDLERVLNDVKRTTDKRPRLQPPAAEYPEFWLLVFDAPDSIGIDPQRFAWAEPEAALAEAADYLQEYALHEEIWGGWPICPTHRTHPLTPHVLDGRAMWTCPDGKWIPVPIGELTTRDLM